MLTLVSIQTTIRLTFSQRSPIQQAIFEYLQAEPDAVMNVLIDRYAFLALVNRDRSESELARILIESNTALARAIEINNAIAARQGITISIDTAATVTPAGDRFEEDVPATPTKNPTSVKPQPPDRLIENVLDLI
jgi:hypothetical protein